VHVNSGTEIKSGSSRFNTGKQNVNSGILHVNTARVNRPVSNQTSYKTSPKLLQHTSQINMLLRAKWALLLRPQHVVFGKELDALALKHLGPVPTSAPTSTNPVNTGSNNLNTGFEEVTPGNIEAISPRADHEEEVFSDADDDEMPENKEKNYDKSSKVSFEKGSYG
ncbi:hypothetical protein Tco_0095262, partial [Tanacetum coccineum]